MKILFLITSLLLGVFASGQDINISEGVVFDGEPYLAINPNNSQHLVVAWMGWTGFAEEFKIKTKVSFNGGATWSEESELPHALSSYTSADPSLAFNSNGEVFVCYIDFTGTEPPVTGGVFISKSEDGGLTWALPTEVINTSYDGIKWPIDRPWMCIDQSTSEKEGSIYVTSMNLNRDEAPFNPYLTVSSDTGATFSTQYLDADDYLAGSINPLPMCSPVVSSDGTFYGAYPSYVLTQSIYAQVFLAVIQPDSETISHKLLITYNPPTHIGEFPDAKKAALLLSDPSNPAHLAYVYLSAIHGDLDVFLIESFDMGDEWSTPVRINDDPISNNRMQDMVWGDFDNNGNLIISWRDRRNGDDSTYQTPSEVWAAFRMDGATEFAPNFQISTELVAYDTILESAGNDFMCVKMQGDTINAVWGDTRDGRLNIWFQNRAIDGTVLSFKLIASDEAPALAIYPNPTRDNVAITGDNILNVSIYDVDGRLIEAVENASELHTLKINLENQPIGLYLVEVKTVKGLYSKKIIKQ